MRASEWDYNQWPPPVITDANLDHTGEPVGYDLDAIPLYEQPPTVARPVPPPSPAVALSTHGAGAGLALSLLGAATALVLSFLSLPLLIMGLIISASALRDIRQGIAAGRREATVGVVVGILGIALAAFLTLNWQTGMLEIMVNP